MTNYSFDRFTVLVVEDNSYLRTLLVQSLKALGVGNIRHAKDGGEAIETLRLMASDQAKAGLMNIDLILSNWQMSPVDGMMLLRWVRRHKESPNRFIPFIMVTGYADHDKVEEARNMGVTEFIAKPFSVNSVATKILRVIDQPRQYVHNPTYFGPDRRRRSKPVSPDDERRIRPEKEVEIVYDSK